MRGWDVIRRERFERQKKLGIIAADAELPAALPGSYDWNKLSAKEKDRFDTMMAVYAAVIHRADRSIGTLVDRLRESGELDNTLILLMSENGGTAERSEEQPYELQSLK